MLSAKGRAEVVGAPACRSGHVGEARQWSLERRAGCKGASLAVEGWAWFTLGGPPLLDYSIRSLYD